MEYVRGLAAVLMDSGREAEALEVYRQLMAQPGLSGQDLFAIGVGFYQANDYVNAATAFGNAAELNAMDRDALEMQARSMMLNEVFEGLPEIAKKWVELDPFSQNGYLIWAQAANKTGDTEGTQQAMNAAQELTVSVDQLQLRRTGGGGGVVSGSVVNKTLDPGASVTLKVTFFGTSGSPIGTVTEAVTVGAPDMAEIFQIQFDSAETVGGYSYELTVG
jgi:tetratricopeptide (TPR) repeat protein